jgi:hypothetical protein
MKNLQTFQEFINENKLSLNEGQFSWMTQDSGKQIGSERQNTITVFMFDDKGTRYEENKYAGYGVFGGKDYYDLLAQMNGYNESDVKPGKELRNIGIDLAFGKAKTKVKGGKVLYPALVEDPKRFNFKRHDFTEQPDNDPNQSWYQEEEYEDDDYFGDDEWDEDER